MVNRILVIFSCILTLSTQNVSSQEICMVSADYSEATRYIIMWERPVDAALYDSVIIYRKRPDYDLFYAKIGSVGMLADSTWLTDMTSNTIIKTQYKISYKYADGTETPKSFWHQASILDYNGGTLTWTLYEKEDQIDESWITSYSSYREDWLGLGFINLLGTWLTQTVGTNTSYFDTQAILFPNARYQMSLEMPDCEISNLRTNIHTSRSNIKQQISNSDSTVIVDDAVTTDPAQTSTIEETRIPEFFVYYNALNSSINVNIDGELFGAEYKIIDATGRILSIGVLNNSTTMVDAKELATGTYYLVILKGSTVHAKAIVTY